jgi:hypothetical protein
VDDAFVEVEVVPPESAQFARTQAKRDGQGEQRLQAACAGPGTFEAELAAAGAAGDGGQIGADLGWGCALARLGAACERAGVAGRVGRAWLCWATLTTLV